MQIIRSNYFSMMKKFQEIVNEENIENITGTVAKLTKDAVKFTPTDINKIAEVLERTTEIDNVPEEV